MLNIVLISQIIIRMRSIISRSCLFFSVTASVSSRFSCNNFLYSSFCVKSGLLSGSSLNGNKLSIFVCSIPTKDGLSFSFERKENYVMKNNERNWQFLDLPNPWVSLHFSKIKRKRLNSNRIVRNCSVTFFAVVVGAESKTFRTLI